MSTPILATKLYIPPPRPNVVLRSRLIARLHAGLHRKLTLIAAPAGFGKTTLLSSLPLLLPDYPLAWITLETEDNDPIRFIGLLATSLQRLHPDCGSSVWPLIAGGETGLGIDDIQLDRLAHILQAGVAQQGAG